MIKLRFYMKLTLTVCSQSGEPAAAKGSASGSSGGPYLSLSIYIYMYMYIYIYIYIYCFSPSSTQHRDVLYEARGSEQNRVKPYVTHRHFGSEHCIHQHEPEQSHRGRAKREKKRGRGGRTREKKKRGGKPRDHPGFFRACLDRPGQMNK